MRNEEKLALYPVIPLHDRFKAVPSLPSLFGVWPVSSKECLLVAPSLFSYV